MDELNIIKNLMESVRLEGPGNHIQFLQDSFVISFFVDRDIIRRISIEIIENYSDIMKGVSVKLITSVLTTFIQIEMMSPDFYFETVPYKNKNLYEYSKLNMSEKLFFELFNKLDIYLKNEFSPALFLRPANIPCRFGIIHPDFIWFDAQECISDVLHGVFETSEYLGLRGVFPPVSIGRKQVKLPPDYSLIGCTSISRSDFKKKFNVVKGFIFLSLTQNQARIFTAGSLSMYDRTFCMFNNTRTRHYNSLGVDYELYGECSSALPVLLTKSTKLIFIEKYDDVIVSLLTGTHAIPKSRILKSIGNIGTTWKSDVNEQEIFSGLSQALSSLFDESGDSKTKVVGGICKYASNIPNINAKACRIYDMRCKVLHGESRSIEEALDDHGINIYLDYYKKFSENIVEDQEFILRTCLYNLSGV